MHIFLIIYCFYVISETCYSYPLVCHMRFHWENSNGVWKISFTAKRTHMVTITVGQCSTVFTSTLISSTQYMLPNLINGISIPSQCQYFLHKYNMYVSFSIDLIPDLHWQLSMEAHTVLPMQHFHVVPLIFYETPTLKR